MLSGRVLLGAIGAVASATAFAAIEPTRHPALVDLAATECSVCHEDVVRSGPFVHAPAEDDCSLCHRVEVLGDRTSVQLLEEEPALCLTCHSELTRHSELDVASPHLPVGDSCLACHDAHAGRGNHLLSGPVVEVCGDCHEPEELASTHAGQLTSAGSCGSCHDAHGSDNELMLIGRSQHGPFAEGSCEACHRPSVGGRTRLRARGNRLCLACHADIGEEEAGTLRHRALEARRGRSGCLNCHDAHLSELSSLLKRDGPALCQECHGEVVRAAGAPDGHSPAGEDCLTCHLPHAAGQDHLLSDPANTLCEMCHDFADPSLTRAHLGADVAGLDCVGCHSPHGADQPHLLARVVHAPLLDGCDLCHEGSAGKLAEGGGTPLCSQCHEDVERAAAARTVPHDALELGECSTCHNPHASAQDHLVRSGGGEICIECHEEQAPGPDEVIHGVVGPFGCQACHEPHGGDQTGMLRVSGPDLCLSCHDPRRLLNRDGILTTRVFDAIEIPAEVVRSMATLHLSADGQHDHPVTGHRVLGAPTEAELEGTDSTYRGEFTCLTCHDPHKGRSTLLLRWGAASAFESCAHCHVK